MHDLLTASRQSRAWACYDCGKCTASCPIARVGGSLSPRRHVLRSNSGDGRELLQNGALFSCLTCRLCDQRCPAGVAYIDLVQRLRALAFRDGVEPECPHGGSLQSLMRMMARGSARQDRLRWLNGDLKTDSAKGEVFYWTGCSPYYDAFFTEFRSAALKGNQASLKLLNKLGVTPIVSPDERCCGHDLLWNGDRKNFELLAAHNVKLIEDSGARTLVTSCAECLRTWRLDYAPFFKGKPPQMLHMTEFISERVGELKFKRNGQRHVTFQDPCRLGRHLGVYEPPRKVLAAIPGLKLTEMKKSGPAATCCAGGTWSNCDRFAKKIQVNRLTEARATGAEVMITACPKCQIHFRCAMRDPRLNAGIEIEMKDWSEVVAEAVE